MGNLWVIHGHSWALTSSSSVTTRQSKQVCFALAAPSVRVKKKKRKLVVFDVVPTEFDSISVAHYSNLPEFDSKFLAFDSNLPAFNAERGGSEKDTNYHEKS